MASHLHGNFEIYSQESQHKMEKIEFSLNDFHYIYWIQWIVTKSQSYI